MLSSILPQKISSRIIALILFILIANAALTGIFSIQYYKKFEQQQTFRALHAIADYVATNGSADNIDKVLEAYQIKKTSHPPLILLPSKNHLLQAISSNFNRSHVSKILLYEHKDTPKILYILYTNHPQATPVYLTIPQQPIEKYSGGITYAEEFIILFLIFFGSYFTAKTINDPLQKIMNSLKEFGFLNKSASPIPEEGPTEIKQLAKSVNQMIANHHALAKERELMLAGISHDLRTPLTRLQLLAELSTAAPETIDAMKEEIDQITKMQQQFIDYVSASTQEKTDWVHLNEFCQDLSNKYHLSGQHIDIKNKDSKDIILETQPIGLYRILMNGINNAIKYGKPPFIIELEQHEQKAVIKIIDHGPGVPEYTLTEIFKPLYRGDSARQNADGSGLGLAIISRIVTRLNGKISAYNIAPCGFCLEISLPLT